MIGNSIDMAAAVGVFMAGRTRRAQAWISVSAGVSDDKYPDVNQRAGIITYACQLHGIVVCGRRVRNNASAAAGMRRQQKSGVWAAA